MKLRVAIRNWLLKPSKAELAGDSAAVAQAGELVYGHIRREIARMEAASKDVIAIDLTPEESEALERDWEGRP